MKVRQVESGDQGTARDVPPGLLDIALDTRSLFERLLALSEISSTAGTCLHACILVCSCIKAFLPQQQALIRGGDGCGDGGFLDANGVIHGHYWVECNVGSDRWIVDISADQFGSEAPLVLPYAMAHQYIPGDQGVVDRHVRDEVQTMAQPSLPIAEDSNGARIAS